ncbi:glutathione S-transferase family protein [Sandaracinus amylolyticus]|nr:glutathione S-transferase [Sandaracinus amylolyticus]
MTKPPIRLHRHVLSGHSHRVELFLSLLGLPSELVDVDITKGAHKAPEFLRKNAFGQLPVIEDEDFVLPDSSAILVYLAKRYDTSGRWLPSDARDAAQVQRWLSVAAGQLVQGPAVARLVKVFRVPRDADQATSVANQLFGVLEAHLASRRFFVGDGPTIADIALYSYTRHAPEGGISLEPYPSVRAWLERIEALPGFVPMKASAVA